MPSPVKSSTFNSGANGPVNCVALQPDGKIIVAGSFTTLSGQPCTNLGRINGDGALDLTFNANAPAEIRYLVLQPDGKLLAAGPFISLGGQARTNLGRLNIDGSLDSAYDPNVYGFIASVALQPDGKLFVGGGFTAIGAQACTNLGRLNTDGSLDPTFKTSVNGEVKSLALQSDGKLLVGGYQFTTLGGQVCTNLGRLNADGSFDPTFISPAPGGWVDSLAVQGDGKILLTGGFLDLAGQESPIFGRLMKNGTLDPTFNTAFRNFMPLPVIAGIQTDGEIMFTTAQGFSIVRFNADGTTDTNFVRRANGPIQCLAIQPDGELVVGGSFGSLRNQPARSIGRVANTGPVDQRLWFDGTYIYWLRSGTGPDFCGVSFEGSTNGVDWVSLGPGIPISGGWWLAGVNFPTNGNIRARGFVGGSGSCAGEATGSAWFVEKDLGAPVALSQPATLVYYTGSAGSLGAGVSGTEPLSYQWFFDDVALPAATNAMLNLTNIQSSDAGRYSVVATNLYGSISNTVATLIIVPVPGTTPIVIHDFRVIDGLGRFSWNTVYGLTYEIQMATNLDHAVWTFFNGPVTNSSIISGDYSFSWFKTNVSLQINALGSTLGFSDPGPQVPKRYYRVRYAQ